MIYKFSNNELSIGTANTVYDCPIIRVVNSTTGVVNCTMSVNSSVNIASFSVLANSEILIEKMPTYRIQGTGLVASPIAYRY